MTSLVYTILTLTGYGTLLHSFVITHLLVTIGSQQELFRIPLHIFFQNFQPVASALHIYLVPQVVESADIRPYVLLLQYIIEQYNIITLYK